MPTGLSNKGTGRPLHAGSMKPTGGPHRGRGRIPKNRWLLFNGCDGLDQDQIGIQQSKGQLTTSFSCKSLMILAPRMAGGGMAIL